jgi:two-component system chemotaxis response regulator CheY
MAKLVYVIDDDTVLRTAYAAALHKLGYNVETAVDGLEGQDLLTKAKPDLIVLDMLMPNLDGLGFLKALRKDDKHKDVRVVVVSNFESMPETEGMGVEKYLSKLQYGPDAIAAQVDRILQGK